jgi:hypothetical protein
MTILAIHLQQPNILSSQTCLVSTINYQALQHRNHNSQHMQPTTLQSMRTKLLHSIQAESPLIHRIQVKNKGTLSFLQKAS